MIGYWSFIYGEEEKWPDYADPVGIIIALPLSAMESATRADSPL
jgi:hypothetical protein